MTQTTRLYNVPTAFFRTSKKEVEKLSKTKWQGKSGEGRQKRRGGETRHRGGDITHSQLQGIQKVKCHPAISVGVCDAPAQRGGGGDTPARKQEGGGGLDRVRSGKQKGGPPASPTSHDRARGRKRGPVPCNDFILLEEPPLPPRARFGPVRGAGGPTRWRPRWRGSAANGSKGLLAGEGIKVAQTAQGGCSAGTTRSLTSRVPYPPSPRGERPECRAG